MVIYKITNLINGDLYVGKTAKGLPSRIKTHKESYKSSQTYIHRAMKKYGFVNFKFEVLEHITDITCINDRERYWISYLDCLAPKGYNMTLGGEGGDTSSSENWIKGMESRKSLAGENNPMYGRSRAGTVVSRETGVKISKAQSSNWNLNPNRRIDSSNRVLGSKNPMFGKTPSNSHPIELYGVSYPSKAAAIRAGYNVKQITEDGILK